MIQIMNDDFRALACEVERMTLPQTSARTGYQYASSTQASIHASSSPVLCKGLS
jgi:hypothetical protein